MLYLSDISMQYQSSSGATPILKGVSMHLETGDFCALTGASGSGKTTLLNLIGLLDRPTAGRITLDNVETQELSSDDVAVLRNRCIGFVFQSFHLLPHMTVLQNVCLPLVYRGTSLNARKERAISLLEEVGLCAHEQRYPDELSGGQRQRVAIARALVGRPSILLADEPTGNLDSQSADEIISLFLDLNQNYNLTVLMVTHDSTIAARCPRRIVMRDGMIVADNSNRPHLLEAAR